MSKIFNPLTNRIIKENSKIGKIIKEIKQSKNNQEIKKIAKKFRDKYSSKIGKVIF